MLALVCDDSVKRLVELSSTVRIFFSVIKYSWLSFIILTIIVSFFRSRHQFAGDAASVSCSLSGSSKDLNKPVENSVLSYHASFHKSGSLKRPSLNAPSQHRELDGKTFCSAGVCTFGDAAVGAPSSVSEEKIGVLLLNLGGPDTLHDVEPFLFNLFADPVRYLSFLFLDP